MSSQTETKELKMKEKKVLIEDEDEDFESPEAPMMKTGKKKKAKVPEQKKEAKPEEVKEETQTPMEQQAEMIKSIRSNPKDFMQNHEMDPADLETLARQMRNDPEAMKEINKLMRERGVQDAVLDDESQGRRHDSGRFNRDVDYGQKIMSKKEAKREKKKMREATRDPLAEIEEDWKCVKITRSKQLKPFLLKKAGSDKNLRSRNMTAILLFFQMKQNEQSNLGCYELDEKDFAVYYDKRSTRFQNPNPRDKYPTNKVIKKLAGFDLGAEVIVCSAFEDEDLSPNDKRLK